MRMWMVDPDLMCDTHLLGEHVETHMLAGSLARRRSIAGYIERGLLEPASLGPRHAALAGEMAKRSFRHASPLPDVDMSHLPEHAMACRVDQDGSLRELARRCPGCRARIAERSR